MQKREISCVEFLELGLLKDMGARRIFSRGGQIHRRSQDFLWECTFFLKKLTTFLVAAC